MVSEGITLEKENGVAKLNLNRPDQMNALTLPMFDAITEAIREVAADDSVKLLVISGAGKAFCSGIDLAAFQKVSVMSKEELAALMDHIALALFNFPKPVIASINGPAVGAGLSIALLSDFRIASDKSRFATGYIRVGLVPDIGATYVLPRLLGYSKALEFMLSSPSIDAAEALRLGLVNRVVPDYELVTTTEEMAEKIIKDPGVAVRLIKQALRLSLHNNFQQQLKVECDFDYECLRTEDHHEAIRAFAEKRQADFKGR